MFRTQRNLSLLKNPAPPYAYTLSLHDALPTYRRHGEKKSGDDSGPHPPADRATPRGRRSEEHTSELQSRLHLVCRLLLEKKKQMVMHSRPTPSPVASWRYCGCRTVCTVWLRWL